MRWTQDTARLWLGLAIALATFGIFVGIVFGLLAPIVDNLPLFVGGLLLALLGCALLASAVLRRLNPYVDSRFRRRRELNEAWADDHGWIYSAEEPPPAPEICEATFHQSNHPHEVVRSTEVVRGTFNGWTFASSHLDGRTIGYGRNNEQGEPRSENIVVVTLPGLLPELRLRDRSAGRYDDYGLALPKVPMEKSAFSARWDVQTRFPDFARQLLTPDLMSHLTAAPQFPCTIVVRSGYLIACRDPRGDPDSIQDRLELLTRVAERIPAECWGNTNPVDAGAGVYTPRLARVGLNLWSTERTIQS
jgi:hypothetical protein